MNSKKCPNCSQIYQLKCLSPSKPNIPLFLACGHSMCESCIGNIVKIEEPIQCKVCQRDMIVPESDLTLLRLKELNLYQLFPVHYALLGEITLQDIEQNSEGPRKSVQDDYYIDLKAIIQSTDRTQAQCLECHQPTTKICEQCSTTLCCDCFHKTHKDFFIFKNHVLNNIEAAVQPNNCETHQGKLLDYYCKDCSKSICMDCLMLGEQKSCKSHNTVTIQEMNPSFIENLNNIFPKVEQTFKRLTKTAVDVGHLLYNIENETGSKNEIKDMLANVEQNFSKLSAAIQKHKKEVTDSIVKIKCSEKESLYKVKDDLADAIKQAKIILNSISMASDPKKAKQANLCEILNDVEQIVGLPWYLAKDESDDPLKLSVNDNLCSLVSDYIQLEGSASSVYKLRSTSELGPEVDIPPPPVSPVYPPELPKDARVSDSKLKNAPKLLTEPPKYRSKTGSVSFNTSHCSDARVSDNKLKNPPKLLTNPPKYRSKSGSVSSLNSTDSDRSFRSNVTIYGDGFHRPMVDQVQQFAESQPPPKKLKEGSQELVYISRIVDPQNFFVQRSCHQDIVKMLNKEFQYSSHLPTPVTVTEGDMYLVLNKDDNMWQRCRVVGINRRNTNNPTFVVFCVDFGNTKTVTIDKLRLTPPARMQSPHPLAISCALANCEPVTGVWATDDKLLMREIVENKQVVMLVRGVRSTAGWLATLEVDIVTLDNGVSLAHALVFHERATTPKRLPYPKIAGIDEKPKLFINKSDCKPGAKEEVYITHIAGPDKFFVRKRHLETTFEKLCKELDQEYGSSDNAGRVYLPEVGMSCVVYAQKFSASLAGGGWARAQVTALPGRQRVQLVLVDCGALLLAHYSLLRYIRTKFTTINALATECHLSGVTPLKNYWSPASVALLQCFETHLLTMLVHDTHEGSVGVTLYDHGDPDNVVCVNTEMIKYKFAVTFGIFNKTPAVKDQLYTNKSPLDESSPNRSTPEVQILSISQAAINESELKAKNKGPVRLEAKILHYQSPSVFYISLVHQQKEFNELFEKIQGYYASDDKPPSKSEWAAGDRCCTISAQSQTWRRAVILETLCPNTAKVFYPDFAYVETVDLQSLRELPPEFATMRDAAIKCHLCGITPADSSEQWPSITKEYLKELLDAYNCVFITKLGEFKNNSMPVEVWVYHTIHGDALEPNVSEWRCLNRKIVEQGLGVPNTTQQIGTEAENTKDDMLGFLKGMSGSVEEWLQLEAPMEPAPTLCEDADKADLDQGEACGFSTDSTYITDWLPPEPLANREFVAMLTHIDNDGVIYLHTVKQETTLDLIRNALDTRFKVPDPKAKSAKWAVGELCIARFFLDERFYRGRVLEVDEENSVCLIHYVDYGNVEKCECKDLRKSIVLYQIPIQAHRCAFARIRPLTPKWDRNTLEYIQQSIIKNKCLVHVIGEPIDGIVPVDIKFEVVWMNDHLVDIGMADYTDGSKRVKHKFAPTNTEPNPVEPIVIELDPDHVPANDSTQSFIDLNDMKDKDWNELIMEEEAKEPDGKLLFYPPNDLEDFLCLVNFISSPEDLGLTVIHNDETKVLYNDMYAKLQLVGGDMPPLDGVFLNKACLAVYHEDKMWYRAIILRRTDDRVLVRYVDYGNVAVINLADIRELSDEFTKLPPATVCTRLYGIELNVPPDYDLKDEYTATFIEKTESFHAKVIRYDGALSCVELTDDNGQLVYESLIKKGIFNKSVP